MNNLATIALGLTFSLSLSFPAFANQNPSFAMLPSPPPSCDANDSSCIVITENQSLDLADWGALDFIGIVEDSRCPLDALCVWAGRVRVALKHYNQDVSEKFEVGLGGDLKPLWIDTNTGLRLSLEQVWPDKLLAAPNDEPYQIKLKVENPADQSR